MTMRSVGDAAMQVRVTIYIGSEKGREKERERKEGSRLTESLSWFSGLCFYGGRVAGGVVDW